MQPIVRVIAATQFFGVPEELLPDGLGGSPKAILIDKRQDEGTHAERLIECAGRSCYDSYGTGRSSTDFHANILNVAHGSILEHAYITVFTTNISRGLTHELVRHRIGVAISQRSTRYVDEAESLWIWHPLIGEFIRDESVPMNTRLAMDKDLAAVETTAREVYVRIVSRLQGWLNGCRGVSAVNARKQARGAARGALGNALNTAMVWTTNYRNLRNVLEQRASEFADAEIRVWANYLFEAVQPFCPAYLNDYKRSACPDQIGYALTTDKRKI